MSAFGAFTLASAAVETQTQLLLLRLLTGLGIGGVAANAVALVAEYAPSRMRTTLIVIAQTGLTLGSMLPAVASGFLEEAYGWQSQFIVGGAVPLAIVVVMLFALPESLKFMVAARRPAEKIRRLANALDPTLSAGRDTIFMAPEAGTKAERSKFKQLFANDLAWITPVIWATFVTFLMTNYFLHSWMPIMFRDAGLSVHETAATTAMLDVGGLLGAIVVSRLLDTRGVAALLVLFIVACPAVAAIGFIGNSVYLLGATIFLAGFCTVGITLGMNAVAGVVYPTAGRAKGVGWAGGIGRLGSISGSPAGRLADRPALADLSVVSGTGGVFGDRRGALLRADAALREALRRAQAEPGGDRPVRSPGQGISQEFGPANRRRLRLTPTSVGCQARPRCLLRDRHDDPLQLTVLVIIRQDGLAAQGGGSHRAEDEERPADDEGIIVLSRRGNDIARNHRGQ